MCECERGRERECIGMNCLFLLISMENIIGIIWEWELFENYLRIQKPRQRRKEVLSFCHWLEFLWVILWILSLFMSLCAQSCLTLDDTLDCNPLGSSVHGIFQGRIMEWAVISYSRGSSWSRYWNYISSVPCIAGGFFTTSPTGSPSVSS